MTRRFIPAAFLLMMAAVLTGCAVERPHQARPTHRPYTLAYLQADELDSFEEMGQWAADSADDPVQLSLSNDYVTSGATSLRVEYFPAGAKKFTLHKHIRLDLSKASRLSVDVYNDGPAGELALGFQTPPSWRYYETPRTRLDSGWNRGVSFDVASRKFSADGGAYTSWLANRSQVARISLVFFSASGNASRLYFDSLRFDRRIYDILPGVPPSDLTVETNASAVDAFQTLELDVQFVASFGNPFDSDDVHVFGQFFSPSGKVFSVDGFPYEVTPERPILAVRWKIRFTPTETGRWTYEVGVRNKFGQAWSPRGYFLCRAALYARGFIRRSALDPLYFEYDNGEFFYPLGQNVAWARDFRPHFEPMRDAGANLVRVWLCSWGLALDLPKEPGKINLKEAGRVDELFEQARENGLHVMLCLYAHGELTFA